MGKIQSKLKKIIEKNQNCSNMSKNILFLFIFGQMKNNKMKNNPFSGKIYGIKRMS